MSKKLSRRNFLKGLGLAPLGVAISKHAEIQDQKTHEASEAMPTETEPHVMLFGSNSGNMPPLAGTALWWEGDIQCRKL